MSVTVTLPDGKELQLEDGATGADAAAAIGPGLAKAAIDYVQIEQNHCGLMFKDAASPGKLANAKRDRWRAFTSATN